MKKNKKGFTLVELLAVIVVLALIMILAVPNVLNSMNNARKGTFKLQGQKILNAATEMVESKQLTTDAMSIRGCYSLNALGVTAGSYKGSVYVDYKNGEYLYTLYLYDGNFTYNAAPYNTVQGKNGNDSINPATDDDASKGESWSACLGSASGNGGNTGGTQSPGE